KGFSNHYIHPGIEKRESTDIDFLYLEREVLRMELMEQGFHEFKTETGHEFSGLKRDEICIDLHKYVPVFAYPVDIEQVQKSGDKTASNITLVASITYQDIMDNSVLLFKNVYIPDMTMSLLILCSSMFRDFLSRLNILPHFKLVDLLEAKQLLENSSFQMGRFVKLVEKFKAYDSVQFVGTVLKQLYGVSPFPDNLPKRSLYPQIKIWNFNSWHVPSAFWDCLMNDRYSELYAQIGAVPLHLRQEEEILISNSPALTGLMMNFYQESTDDSKLEISLGIKTVAEEFSLRLEVYHVSGIDDRDIISFNFGKLVKTYYGSVSRGMYFGITTMEEEIEYSRDERKLTLAISLPHTQLTDLLEDGIVPLNVYVEKYESNIEYDCSFRLLIEQESLGD
ncbi:MAG: hypothetical protein WD907_03800, partial [Bacilli bacterium]